MENNQTSFLLYHDMWEQFESLSDEEAGKIMKAIFIYHTTWEIVSMDRLLTIVFISIRKTLDRDRGRWLDYIEKQHTNGKKWGRPRNNPENPTVILKTQPNPSKPKKADSVSVSVSVPVSVPVTFNTNTDVFDSFWTSYPIKQWKKKAREVYKKLEREHDAIMLGLQRHIKYWSQRWKTTEFIPNTPHATTFLNERRWEDELDIKEEKKQSYNPL